MTNVPIFKNSGPVNGGALYLNGSPTTISGGTLSENSTNGRGGAVWALASPLTLTNVPISKNIGPVDGGAFYLDQSNVAITGGTLSENSTNGRGGAMVAIGGTVLINKTPVTKHSATQGGGALYLDHSFATLIESTLSENVSDGHGGALVVLTGTLSLTNTTWTANVAQEDGGAIYGVGSALTGTIASFVENRAEKVGSGGAIFWEGERLALHTNIQFLRNTAAVESVAARSLVDPLAAEIEAAYTPHWLPLEQLLAAGKVKNGLLEVTPDLTGAEPGMAWSNAIAALQEPLREDVGHLVVPAAAPLTVQGPQARATRAAVDAISVITTAVVTGSGGTLYTRNVTVTLTATTLDGNNAQQAGGAIYAEGGRLNADTITLNNNRARTAPGGGFYLNRVRGTMRTLTLTNNRGSNGGGGYTFGGGIAVDVATIRGNVAAVDGGGIFFVDGQNSLANGIVEANKGDRGGGLYATGGAFSVTLSTIQDNQTSFRARPIFAAAYGHWRRAVHFGHIAFFVYPQPCAAQQDPVYSI